jgi:15-cis-phytoene desaturase
MMIPSISLAFLFVVLIPAESFSGSMPCRLMPQPKNSRLCTHLKMSDFPKPNVEDTKNYRMYEALSRSFRTTWNIDGGGSRTTSPEGKKKTVAIIGGGLSGLACAKYLSDAGHACTVYEARDVLGGKVSAWQDSDGDWIETGLHIFFGAYPNVMNLFAELNIQDRLQWKAHKMIFAMQEFPGEFTSFDFIPGIPAPFNFILAILSNQKMLSWREKLQTAPALLPMLLFGQQFIDGQDEYSVLQYMRKYGMPERINKEVFVSMAKALDFINPDKLSMSVVLTAMNRFINEANGSQIAFLDGNQPDRLCKPMVDHIVKCGGRVLLNQPVEEIVTNSDGSVKHLLLRSGHVIVADEYVSAMPVDIMKRMVPLPWQRMPFFRQLDELEGIPVINLQLWFDQKLKSVDHLCFSRSPLLSVYADMSVTCNEYSNPDASMLELVFAPCSALAGGDENWISKRDEEIVDATMGELARLFPTEIAVDGTWPSTCKQEGRQGQAKLRKYAVVRTPRSVYAAIPGRNKYRPTQKTPIPNFTLAGDYTCQKYLGSMEGAVLAGKLAAEAIARKAVGDTLKRSSDLKKPVMQHVVEKAAKHLPRQPLGIQGGTAISFGGGSDRCSKDSLAMQDPVSR